MADERFTISALWLCSCYSHHVLRNGYDSRRVGQGQKNRLMGAQAAYQIRAVDPEATTSTHRGCVQMGTQETVTKGEQSQLPAFNLLPQPLPCPPAFSSLQFSISILAEYIWLILLLAGHSG